MRLDERATLRLASVGLLLLRIGLGGTMLAAHGLGKLSNFSAYSEKFPDPIGLGPAVSLALAIFAEAVCSLAVVLGAATRFAAVPIVVTMLVAAVIVHGDDPWEKKELAVVYAIAFFSLVFTGPGAFSIDGLARRRR